MRLTVGAVLIPTLCTQSRPKCESPDCNRPTGQTGSNDNLAHGSHFPFISLQIPIYVCYIRLLIFRSCPARSALSSVRSRLVSIALLVTRAASLELCALVVLASAESRKTPGGTIGLGEVLRDGLRAKTVLISWR